MMNTYRMIVNETARVITRRVVSVTADSVEDVENWDIHSYDTVSEEILDSEGTEVQIEKIEEVALDANGFTNGQFAKLQEVFNRFGEEDEEEIDGFRLIIADQYVSELGLGGDGLVSIADMIVNAINDGYLVKTWYGPDAECLIVGVRPEVWSKL